MRGGSGAATGRGRQGNGARSGRDGRTLGAAVVLVSVWQIECRGGGGQMRRMARLARLKRPA
jgi:hypothetical protein